ncbi:hypothetical protein PBY51_014589 [Eleginops maclovinus]|uniref:Secreted protein n=1 Tax=Eleginops maclovinus TaxID=56733 RepID=A0AAN7ZZQ1_ELEMC|nr:hypothetical protein PBY51_014589 [Eleginops maclovinus]
MACSQGGCACAVLCVWRAACVPLQCERELPVRVLINNNNNRTKSASGTERTDQDIPRGPERGLYRHGKSCCPRAALAPLSVSARMAARSWRLEPRLVTEARAAARVPVRRARGRRGSARLLVDNKHPVPCLR